MPFFASLFWADFLSCSNIINKIAEADNRHVLAIVAALGVSTILLGFIIGAITIAFFHLIEIGLKVFRKGNWNYDSSFSAKARSWSYESSINKEAYKKIWHQLELKRCPRFAFQKRFYISGTFDHDILPEGINE